MKTRDELWEEYKALSAKRGKLIDELVKQTESVLQAYNAYFDCGEGESNE